MNQKYLIKILLSIAALITTLSTAVYLGNSAIAGIGLVAAYFTFRSAEKTSHIRGKTPETKLLNSSIPNLIEFSALATTPYFIPETSISVLATALTGFSVTSKTQADNNTNRKIHSLLGRKERILVLSTVFIAGLFNSYLVLYGLIVLSTFILADLVYTVYRFFN